MNVTFFHSHMIPEHPLYPLRFRPIPRSYIWGGGKLAVLGKDVPSSGKLAETWEIVDRPDDQSIVVFGPLAGAALGRLVSERGRELLGRHASQQRFPLLFKFLDAAATLSVQVHPDDAQAAKLVPPDAGKTEAWFVLEAEPGSKIYSGLKRGIDRAALEEAIPAGKCEECLHWFEPSPGDCVLLPAGTVHALGGGLLVVEIQQSSDVTYRLFDWNRIGPDGHTRPLHVEQGLEAIDFDRGPVDPLPPRPTERAEVSRLVECDKFVLDRWEFDQGTLIGGDDRFHIIAVLEGGVRIEGDAAELPLSRGGTALLPAALGKTRLESPGKTVLLDAYLP